MTLARLAVVLALFLAGCAPHRLGRGASEPDVPVPYVIESTEWDVWVGEATTEPCASPCADSTGSAPARGSDLRPTVTPGPVTIGASEHGTRSQHRERFTVEGPFHLSIGRWSHDGERTAGSVLLAVGLVGAAVIFFTSFGVDEATCHRGATSSSSISTGCGLGAAFGGVLAGMWALPMSILGGSLLAWNDHPTYEVSDASDPSVAGPSGTSRAPRVQPIVTPLDGGVSVGVVGSF